MPESKPQGKTPQRPETGRGGGLIPLRTLGTPQLDAHDAYRLERMRRRAKAQLWEVRSARRAAGLDPNGHDGFVKTSRRCYCGKPMRGVGGVSVKLHDDRAHFSGVAHCGSIWACPTCSPIIRRERAAEIAEGLSRHMSAGGGALFVTLTVRHGLRDALRDTMDVLRDAWDRCNRSRSFKALKAELGVCGYVVAQEVTYGRNGWHAHRHYAFLTDRPVEDGAVASVKARFYLYWAAAVDAVGGSTAFDAFDLRPVDGGAEQIGRYVTKIAEGVEGLGREVALADVKAGRAVGSINPFQLLDLDGPEAEALWSEYVEGTKGRAAIRWSRGLRDRLGMGKERTDEEIVEDVDAVGEVELTIDGDLYLERVARKPQVMAGILEAVEAHDLEGAARIVGVSISWEPWPTGELVPRLTLRPSRALAA